MGSSNCTAYCCHLRELRTGAKTDPNYGRGTVRHGKTTQFIYCCEPTCISDSTILLKQAGDRNRISSSLLVPLTSIRKVLSTNPCIPRQSFLIVYPYIKRSLLDQLKDHRQGFSEMEILMVVASISKAYKLLLKRGLRVGLVDSRKVFRGEDGWWKLLDVDWAAGRPEGTQQDREHMYFNERDLCQNKIKKNLQRNIVFSLGVIALQMASLEPSGHLYDMPSKRILYPVIKDLLLSIKSKYYRIHHLIDWMLIQPSYQTVTLDKAYTRSRDLIQLLLKGQEIVQWWVNEGVMSEWEWRSKDDGKEAPEKETGYTSTLNCSPSKITWTGSEKGSKQKVKFSVSKMKSYRNSSINPECHRRTDSKLTEPSRPPSHEPRRTIRFPK